jgi:hypothetical protein
MPVQCSGQDWVCVFEVLRLLVLLCGWRCARLLLGLYWGGLGLPFLRAGTEQELFACMLKCKHLMGMLWLLFLGPCRMFWMDWLAHMVCWVTGKHVGVFHLAVLVVASLCAVILQLVAPAVVMVPFVARLLRGGGC